MWDELFINDEFWKITEQLTNKIYKIDDDGKLKPMMKSQNIVSPWVHCGKNTNRYCSIWMDLYFAKYRFYPSYCKNKCWKVVVYPKNCKETFDIYRLMRNWDFHSKIGIDIRDYTPNKSSNWSAFFYCDSEDHGHEVKKKVENMVATVNPETTVLLKKSCTEMELAEQKGELEQNPDWEKRLDDMYAYHTLDWVEPDWLKNKTMIFWLKYARTIGDTSYREVSPLPADKGKYELY